LVGFSNQNLQLVSQDGVGGPGLGVSGKGMGTEMRSWVSSDGMSLEETVVAYSTDDDARNDFELELRAAEQVIELSRKSSRLVGKFGLSFRVISREENKIKYIESPPLEAVLAFEESWRKHW